MVKCVRGDGASGVGEIGGRDEGRMGESGDFRGRVEAQRDNVGIEF